MQQQQQPTFSFSNLAGADLDVIMGALGDMPAKTSRGVMNKLEQQIMQQVQAMQEPQQQEQAPQAPK